MDAPRTLREAIIHFSDADVCLDFVKQIRWADGVVCPVCNGKEVSFLSTRRIWKCKGCKKQFSAKVGTIFEDSPIGFEKWLPALWLIASAKNGISSYELHRALGVTQKTAWFMLHRIRLAMQSGSIEKTKGPIEADETFIGGKASNMHKAKRKEKIQGRGATGKEIVMGILDRGERKEAQEQAKKGGTGSTVRVKHIPNTKQVTLHGEIKANVEPGAEVFTDAFPGYEGLNPDYIHSAVDHAICYVIGNVHTNGLENFWCLLKRTLRGTHVSVNEEHLFRYLDEQAFRFNERQGNDSDRFLAVLRGTEGKRLTYEQLTDSLSA
jgi:transposase-like protein